MGEEKQQGKAMVDMQQSRREVKQKKRTEAFASVLSGRGSRARTHINGFGDRCSTIELYPFALENYFIIISNLLTPCQRNL